VDIAQAPPDSITAIAASITGIREVISRVGTPSNLELLTWIACGVIFGLFLFAAYWHLFRRIRGTKRLFLNATKVLRTAEGGVDADEHEMSGFQPGANPFREGSDLERRWSDFVTAWISSVSTGSTTGHVDPSAFFPAAEVLGGTTYLRKLEGWPGRFLTLGILGTFAGIALGLMGLEGKSSAPELLPAILPMIAGLTTAFMTSIVGIVFSLIFLFFERRQVSAAFHAIDAFTDAARVHYPYEAPEVVLAKVAFSSGSAADSLHTLENDLASTLSESLGREISDRLSPLIEDIKSVLEKASETTAAAQVEGIERIIEKFMAGMDTQLGGSFEKLGKEMNEASASLGSVTGTLAEAARTQQEMMDKTAITVEVLDRQLPHLLSFGEQLESTAKSFGIAIDRVGELESSLSTSMKQLVELQQATESRFESTTTRLAALGALIKETSESQSESQSRMEAAYKEALESFEENLKGGLVESLQTFDGVLAQVMERFSGTLADLREQYGAVDRHTSALQQSVAGISSSLSNSLSELGEVSTEAHTRIKELSQQYLENTTKGLDASTSAMTAIDGGAERIAASSEALAVQMSLLSDASVGSQSRLAEAVTEQLSSANKAIVEMNEGLRAIQSSFTGFDESLRGVAKELVREASNSSNRSDKGGLFGRLRR
jgi:hypothetical protein